MIDDYHASRIPTLRQLPDPTYELGVIQRLGHRVSRVKAIGVDVEFAARAEVVTELAEAALPTPEGISV
jgi:hypothetical protein